MQEYITPMVSTQNRFLETQISVAVVGFKNIKAEVADLEYVDSEDLLMDGLEPPTMPLNRWILKANAEDGKKLITFIKRGPCSARFFYTPKDKKEEIIIFIDKLGNTLCNTFEYEDICKATNSNSTTRKFKEVPAKHMQEAVAASNRLLAENTQIQAEDNEKYLDVKNCWKYRPKLNYAVINDESGSDDSKENEDEGEYNVENMDHTLDDNTEFVYSLADNTESVKKDVKKVLKEREEENKNGRN
eukprot:15336649-Ditylum_brightwellii.AAC.1